MITQTCQSYEDLVKLEAMYDINSITLDTKNLKSFIKDYLDDIKYDMCSAWGKYEIQPLRESEDLLLEFISYFTLTIVPIITVSDDGYYCFHVRNGKNNFVISFEPNLMITYYLLVDDVETESSCLLSDFIEEYQSYIQGSIFTI